MDGPVEAAADHICRVHRTASGRGGRRRLDAGRRDVLARNLRRLVIRNNSVRRNFEGVSVWISALAARGESR